MFKENNDHTQVQLLNTSTWMSPFIKKIIKKLSTYFL